MSPERKKMFRFGCKKNQRRVLIHITKCLVYVAGKNKMSCTCVSELSLDEM